MRVTVLTMKNDFKKARLRLIALYLCIVGGIIALFTSLVLYQANDSFSDPAVPTQADAIVTANQAMDIAKQAVPEGVIESTEYEIEKNTLYFTTVFTDAREVKVNLITGAMHIPLRKNGIVETLIDDFEERIIGIAFLVFALATILCVYVANKTLYPIVENVQKQKRFISDVTHELRNPLAALHARIESVMRSGVTMFKEEVLKDLLAETKHLIALSENLLALEKNEVLVKHSVAQSLNQVVNSVSDRLEGMRAEKDITLTSTIDASLLIIDTHDLETIVYNLLHNAIKFTPSHGTVAITWHDKQLTIQDSGIGISDEDKKHIFDRFYKADTARTEVGHGLGLALVKETAERYGAKVEISSTLGKGTVISLQFT